jgi:hypothetical protein
VKYDTGAQYYSLKKEMKDVHSRWFDTGMTRTWFSDAKGRTHLLHFVERYCIALRCVVLCCIVLYCSVFYCTVV